MVEGLHPGQVPQAEALGGKIAYIEAGRAEISLDWRADLADGQGLGIGAITTMLDHVSGMAASSGLLQAASTATLDLRVDHLNPARAGSQITARAHRYATGRGVAYVRAEAWDLDNQEMVAASQGAFIIYVDDPVGLAKTAPNLEAFQAHVPYAAFLGARFEAADGVVTGHLPFSPHLIGNPVLPALHGGVIAGFLELAARAQLFVSLGTGVIPSPANLRVDYLRPGRSIPTLARVEVIKLGRKISTVRGQALQEDRPIATLTGTFLMGGQT